MKIDKILVVEDDDNLREAICDFLEFNDLEYISAANGKESLFLLDNETVDLVVCDINLPDILGFQILEYVRNHDKLYRIPFIFLSAFADKKDISNGMNLGADDYITKPFTQKTLIDAIKSRLHKAKLDNTYFTKEMNSRVLETISSNLTHELITPLNGIINGAYFINSVSESTRVSDMKDAFLSMYAAGLRMKRNIQNMILVSVIEMKNGITIDQFNFSSKIKIDQKVTDIIDQYKTINPKTIIDLNIEPVSAIGSHKHLRILFTEIVDNAFKFSDSKQPILINLSPAENGFFFQVSNSHSEGIKFEANEIGLYKKFHVDDSSNGLGLGLFVSKSLCKEMNIDFTVTQYPGSTQITLLSLADKLE